MGHEILTDEVGKFLTSLNVEIQKLVIFENLIIIYIILCLFVSCRVRSEHEQTMTQLKKSGDQLEQMSPQLCIPDPDPSGIKGPDMRVFHKLLL